MNAPDHVAAQPLQSFLQFILLRSIAAIHSYVMVHIHITREIWTIELCKAATRFQNMLLITILCSFFKFPLGEASTLNCLIRCVVNFTSPLSNCESRHNKEHKVNNHSLQPLQPQPHTLPQSNQASPNYFLKCHYALPILSFKTACNSW